MKEAFELIRKKDVLDIIHSHSCNTARIEEGVLNLPVISVFARNDKIKERINDVIERISCGAEKFDYDRGSVDAYRNALSIVSEVEAEYGNGWIDVKDRLPEKDGYYLTCDHKGNIHVFFHSPKYMEIDYAFGIDKNHSRYYQPIAWMELPKPYKTEKGAHDGKRMR